MVSSLTSLSLELWILIASYIRSRHAYRHFALTCKRAWLAASDPLNHERFFLGYMNEGWFHTVDGEVYTDSLFYLRRMSFRVVRAVGCSFRNIERIMEICGMTGNEGSPHVWKHSTFADSILRSDTFDSPSFLSTICQLPPADFDLLVRVAQCGLFDRFDASSGKTTKLNDSISALALFFECDGRRPYIYFNVLVKRTMNALVEGSRLLVLVIHFDLFYAIDEDRRVIKGTAWWRIERPQQRPFISTGDMTSLFGDTRTVFKVKGRTGEFGSSWHNTKLKVHLGGTHTVGAVVNKAKMRVDKDFKGTLGLKDGQSYSWYHADLHDITWEETGILSGIM